MSSRQFSSRIELVLRPSRRLAVYLLILHLAAIVATVVAVMPLAVKILLVFCIAVTLIHEFRHRIMMHGPNAVRRLIRSEDGTWILVWSRGEDTEAELLPGGYVLPWLIIMVFRFENGHKRHMLLTSDSADAGALRELRVLMLLQTQSSA